MLRLVKKLGFSLERVGADVVKAYLDLQKKPSEANSLRAADGQ